MTPTTVLIIGAGALGKSLAALLKPQAEVILFDKDPAVRRALLKGSFTFHDKGRARRVKVRALSSLAGLENKNIDVLIFATKIMDLRNAVEEAVAVSPRHVLFVQNGIFDLEWTKKYFKTAAICRGVTTMACQPTSADEVTLFYRGRMYVGGEGAAFVARLFHASGIRTSACRNVTGSVWSKLIFSSVMNPLPVVTQQGYDMLKDKDTWRQVREAVGEGRAVARTLKVRLAFDPLQLIRRVRNGDLKGIAYRGSMYQDVCAGRPTEIDFMTGALVRHARKAGVKTPVLDLILSKARKACA
jgi:2-dehydropantoate 2-reductase